MYLRKRHQFAVFDPRAPELGPGQVPDPADDAGVHRTVADNQHVFSFPEQRFDPLFQEGSGAGKQVVQAFPAVRRDNILIGFEKELVDRAVRNLESLDS